MIHYIRMFNGNHSAIGLESPNKVKIGIKEKRLLKLGLEQRTKVRKEKEVKRRRRFMR